MKYDWKKADDEPVSSNPAFGKIAAETRLHRIFA